MDVRKGHGQVQGLGQPPAAHLAFMAVLGAMGWFVLLRPDLLPGLTPAIQPELVGLPFAVFLVVIILARSMAFMPMPGTVISPDSGFYVAAALCFGSIASGRMVAVALTVDAAIRLLTGPRRRSPRHWLEAALYVAYFGAMSGALLAVVARVFDTDQTAVFFVHDQWRVLHSVVVIGLTFIVLHYAIQGIRVRLAGQRTGAYVQRMGLPGVLAELSLLPLASVVVFVYEPRSSLGLGLLGGTYVLIAFGFNRLSKAGAKLRKRVVELETLNSASSRLASCLHTHELLQAVAAATTDAIATAEGIAFYRLSEGGALQVDLYEPASGEFRRVERPREGPVARVVDTDATVVISGDDVESGTALGGSRSWLGVPLRVYGAVEAVLAVESKAPGAFDSDDRHLLEGIALQTSVALQNTRHYELAMVDGLTGLYVRRYFDARLDEEFERSRRYETHFAVAMLDLDDFKALNDTHGHAVGDAALRTIARVVREEMRGIDTAARYGGEEIGLVLPRTSLTDSYTQAERIRSRLASTPIDAAGLKEPLMVTASIGIAAHPESGARSAEELLRLADRALYRAKKTGKNRVELYWAEGAEGERKAAVKGVASRP